MIQQIYIGLYLKFLKLSKIKTKIDLTETEITMPVWRY